MPNNINQPPPWLIALSLSLAVATTVISALISALVGWDRGLVWIDQVVWAGVGVLSVLAAHFLLASCYYANWALKVVAIVLWIPCMAFVGNTHVSYFLLMQQQKGAQRANSIDAQALVPQPKRGLQQILTEEARLRAQASGIDLSDCVDDCVARKARKILLEGRANGLVAEADDVRRWQAGLDRQVLAKEAARSDPVSVGVASAVGGSKEQVSLIQALFVSVVLDLVACFAWCWYGYLRIRGAPQLPGEDGVGSSAWVIGEAAEPEPKLAPSHELSSEELLVLNEVTAGKVRPTINGIRQYLRCGQGRASAIRKRLIDAGALPA